jgi:urea transport system permease protein
VLVLAAIGLAITFGVMGVINMAHGELMMLGAYTTYVVQLLMPQHIGASILVAIPAAFLVSGLAGVAIERGIVRHLYGRPLETLLATFGLSLMLQQACATCSRPTTARCNRRNGSPVSCRSTGAVDHLQSALHHRLHVRAVSGAAGGAQAHATGAGGARGIAESGDGQGDGHSHRVGRCDDLWPGLRYRRRRRRRAQST